MSEATQFCTFFLDGLYFGVEVQKVQEVIRYQELTRVPLGPPVIVGLINLRGQIVTAIDLRRQLGLAERQTNKKPMNVVVRTSDGVTSLLVDEIGDVVEVEEGLFEPPPGTLSSKSRELVCGAFKLPQRLLLKLDADKAISLSATSA
jgi:purine-binding chemotaxis protein CheW